jgi:hypothetical protein
MADERRIVTKVYYDTSGVLQGAEAAKAAVASFGGETKKTSKDSEASTRALAAQYQRLVGQIDPAARAQLAYGKTVEVTTALVAKGKITQEQANLTLSKAADAYNKAGQGADAFGKAHQNSWKSIAAGLGAERLLEMGLEKVREMFHETVKAVKEAETAHALLENTYRATGGAVGMTSRELEELAHREGRLAGVSHDVVEGAEAMMLRYHQISGEAFPRAIRLAIDMAAAQGEPIKSTAQLSGAVERLGKVLSDPLRAATLLRREGKALNEEQLRQIDSALRQNDLAKAQAVVFAELESQYGHTAAALRGTLGGAVAAADVAWHELLEEFGKGLFFDLTGINNLTEALSDPEALRSAHELGKALGEIAGAVLKLTSYNDKINAFLKSLADVQTRWQNFVRESMGLSRMPGTDWEASVGHFGTPPPTKPPKPPPDPAEMRRAAAEVAKLTETYRALLAEHAETKRTQEAILALYQRSGLTLVQGQAAEKRINDAHAARAEMLKREREFADLGPAAARRMAEQLARNTAEERRTNQEIEDRKGLLEEIEKLNIRIAKSVGDIALTKLKDNVVAFERATEHFLEAFRQATALREDLSFARQTTATSSDRFGEIERQYLDFIRRIGKGSMEEGEKALTAFLTATGQTVEQIKAKLGELSDLDKINSIRGAGLTQPEIYQGQINELRRLRDVAIANAREQGQATYDIERDFAAKERELVQQRFEEVAGAWGGLVDYMGSALGGVAAKIASLYQQIQGASQMGSQLGSATGIGSAAGGIAGAIVGVWVAAYQHFVSQTAKDRAQSYGFGASVTMDRGRWNEVQSKERQLSEQIEHLVDSFVDAIGGALTRFADLEIQVRRDGKYFSAMVEGQVLGHFETMEEAQQAAILAAFRSSETVIRGMSALARQGLEQFRAIGTAGSSVESLQGWLSSLREVAEIRWDDSARQMAATVRHFDELWDALGRLDTASDTARQGMADLAQTEVEAWQARIRQFSGVPETEAQQRARMEREGKLIQLQLQMRIADIKLREAELREEREALAARGQIVRGGAALDDASLRGGRETLVARAKLYEGEVDLTAAHLAAIDASLEAMAALQAELEQILADFDPANFKLPGEGRAGHGAGAGGGQSLSDMIAESARQRATSGQSQYLQGLAEINRKWIEGIAAAHLPGNAEAQARKQRDEAIKAANGNAEAIKKANDAYEAQTRHIHRTREEIERANEARAAEIALLQEQQRTSVRGDTTSFVEGSNVFREQRDQAAALRLQWQELLDTQAVGAAEYASALAGINRSEAEHLRLLGLQESSTLFGQLQGLLQTAGLGESGDALRLAGEQQRANYALQLAEAQARYAQLVAEGYLIGANRDLVERVLDKLGSVDLGKLTQGIETQEQLQSALAQRQQEAQDAARKAIEDAAKLREKYAAGEDDPLRRRLADIRKDFDLIFASLGRGDENLKLFADAVKGTFDDLKKPVSDWLASLGLSESSPLTSAQQAAEASKQFDVIAARIAGGDTKAFAELAGAGNALIQKTGAAFGTSTAEFQKVWDRVFAIGHQAEALADAMAVNFTATGSLGVGNVAALTLTTQSVVNAILAGNKVQQDAAATLQNLESITDSQAFAISQMAADIASLRQANESMARDLSAFRNARAS